MNFRELLEEQHILQRTSFGVDPAKLEGEAFADYVRWNVLAAHTELSEFLQEIPWKPWKDGNGRPEYDARGRAVVELIDVLHFLANLLLVLRVTPEELEAAYNHKRQVNVARQAARIEPVQVRQAALTWIEYDEPRCLP